MKTQIVYVVTFNESSYFFEQVLISACSARLHNPDARIIIVTDNDSTKLITGWRKEIYKYVNEIKAFDLPDSLNNMQRSRRLKTSLRNIIEGDFIFIDTDTIICRPLDEIDNLKGNIFAVSDMHCPIELSRSMLSIRHNFKTAGLDEPNGIYFNSGVMFVRDTEASRQFYEKWHSNWKELSTRNIFIDQVSLHKTNKESKEIINELPGEWNCQTEGNFLNFLSNSYIIHYYSFSKEDTKFMYFFKNQAIYEEIRKAKTITEGIYERIVNPRQAFTLDYLLLSGPLVERYHNMKYIHNIYSSPRRFWILQKIARILSFDL